MIYYYIKKSMKQRNINEKHKQEKNLKLPALLYSHLFLPLPCTPLLPVCRSP